MCGIAGIHSYHYAAAKADQRELRRIRDYMTARGPDGCGEWFSSDGRTALGHRRLAIIDLSENAAQPMSTPDGALVISFNGEIYNYRALRNLLESKGYQFRTQSDTEVLLHLYAEKGPAMLSDLRGMFAFALWDAKKNAMLLTRDPYGIKPLYYADDGWTLRLASQVKALLAGGEISRTPEPAGLTGFYLLGSVPEPWTLYQEIRSVPAGSYIWVDETGAHTPIRYFSLAEAWTDALKNTSGEVSTIEEVQQNVRNVVLDSVRQHMVADVPVGAFLSAGIDSGTLVALMAEIGNGKQPLKTITLAFQEFEGQHGDEAPLARQVAKKYGAEHMIRTVTEQEFQQDLPAILDAMDQPSSDGINTWFVAKAAKEQGLKVVISGLGGDELFGGYPSFTDIPKWVRKLAVPSKIPLVGRLFRWGFNAFSDQYPTASPKLAGMLEYGGSWPGAWLLRRGVFMPWELPALMGKEQAEAGLARLRPLQHIASLLGSNPNSDIFDFAQVAVLESGLYMRNQLLRDADWAGMAHSLEIRVPLVDAKLLSMLAGLPMLQANTQNKHWLAHTPLDPLPDTIIHRPKSGFTTPINLWQQRNPSIQSWRRVPFLTPPSCPWARRWGYVVMHHFFITEDNVSSGNHSSPDKNYT